MTRLNYIANLRLPTEKAYGIQIAKMCEAFAELGIKVKLTAPFRFSRIHDGFFEYYNVKRNFVFRKLFAPDFYLPGSLDKLAFGVKSFVSALILIFYAKYSRGDVFYFRDEMPLYFISFLIKNSLLFFEAHKFSESRKLWYRRFKSKNIKIITISHGLKDQFLKFGFKNENILVAPDGVDLEEFDPDTSQQSARQKLGLVLDKKIVVYTGHLFEWKGAENLAKTAQILPEVDFIFVGGTDHDILEFRRKFGQTRNIVVVGHKPHKEVPLYLKSADVLVLPNQPIETISELYTSPLKLFEYMASERPIVASDLPSIREILNHENSVLVKPDSESLADGIKKVLGNQTLSNQISARAFKDVQNYTWSNRARKIIDLFHDKS